MTAAELRDKSVAELKEELVRLRRDQFHLRMQRASEQLPQTHLLREARRDIARVNTVMREKAREEQQAQEDALQPNTGAEAETEQAEAVQAATSEQQADEQNTGDEQAGETVTNESVQQDSAEEKAHV